MNFEMGNFVDGGDNRSGDIFRAAGQRFRRFSKDNILSRTNGVGGSAGVFCERIFRG